MLQNLLKKLGSLVKEDLPIIPQSHLEITQVRCPGMGVHYRCAWPGSGASCPDTALQVGTAKVVGDSGVLVDLLGLVAVIETEGETQIRLRFTPWVPPLCPSVVLTHSQGHSQHLDGCAVSTTLLATPRPEQHPGPPSLPLSRCPLPRWALSEVYGPAPRGI